MEYCLQLKHNFLQGQKTKQKKLLLIINKYVFKIFSFCDEVTLQSLRYNDNFQIFHKIIQYYLDNHAKNYWQEMQISHIGKIMQPQMERHFKNYLFGKLGMSQQRRAFLDDWYDSDDKIYGTLINSNIDSFFSKMKNEKKRLTEKYGMNNTVELVPRNFLFNRFLYTFSRDQIRDLIVDLD